MKRFSFASALFAVCLGLLPLLAAMPASAADISITAANVIGTGTDMETLPAGGTVTAGQPVRKNTSNQVLAASDDSAANAAVYGIALNGGGTGQPIQVQKSGSLNLGATLSVGKVYVLSTSGGIAPVDDIGSGEYITVICVATTTALCTLSIKASGVAAAAAVSYLFEYVSPANDEFYELARAS